MEILNSLREGTRKLHADIERDNIGNKIMDHSISLEEYKLLLFQNYIAYRTAEAEIVKFLTAYTTDKSDRLAQDLLELGVSKPDIDLEFTCGSEAEAIGAAYVIEGSAMGGMLMGKEVLACSSLSHLSAQNFFNGERSSILGWNKFLKLLRTRKFSEEDIEAATLKAKDTFLLFKQAFNISLAPTN